MNLFSPAGGGRGRLAVAAVTSILLHCVVLAEWGGVVFLSIPGWGGVASRGGGLSVLLEPYHALGLASLSAKGEAVVSKSAIPDELPQKKSPGEATDAPVLSPPASEDYLTRDRISVSAQPVSEINIPWPPGLPVMGVKSAVFTVFIDELGRVRDVVPDGHTLSPVMEEAARKAFLAALFSPALLNGRAVKSIKRIEVEFEFLPHQGDEISPDVVSTKKLL
ncbi:MAG: hypothetical protein HGA71_10665 [Azonexaceae bacterium]|nr:hypothetical protein [Azonexaceae bacterium]